MTDKSLQRSLGLTMIVVVCISAMLGSGIFVLPGLVAAKTGESIWLAYLIAGICVVPAAFSNAELATAMPTSGGSYVYLERVYGPLVGTVAGLGLWLSMLLKSAFALVGFGAYWMVLFPNIPGLWAAAALLLSIIALNIVGVRKVAQVQLVVVLVSLVGLLFIDSVGLFDDHAAAVDHWHLSHGSLGLFAATALVFVSYDGVTKIAAISEEIKDPGRNLPLGMLISLAIVGFIYTSVTYLMASVIPMYELAGNVRPVFTLAEYFGGHYAGAIAAIVAVLTMTSMANSGLLAASRFPFAMARDRLLPEALKSVHSKYLTPVTCILLTGATMAVIIFAFDVEKIAKLASAFVMMVFAALSLTVILLRETRVQWYRPEFRSPLYPWMQIFGLFGNLAFLYFLGILVPIAIASLVAPGIILYYLYGKHRTKRQGVVRLYGRRALAPGLSPAARVQETAERRNTAPVRRFSPMPSDGNHEREKVVVPLLGKERSPETLLEIGAALAHRERVHVVSVTEAPEQRDLDYFDDEDQRIDSLRRRLEAAAQVEKFPAHFEAVLTHDVLRTLYDLDAETHADWLVMEWDGSSTHGLFLLNPVGWVVNHLTCNLALFKDAGVRYIREILVYCEPGPDEALVAETADQLAAIHSAQLTFVGIVAEQAPESERTEIAAYLEEIRKECSSHSKTLVIQSEDKLRDLSQLSTSYDLLVTGAPETPNTRQRLWTLFTRVQHDRLTEMALCSVLRLRTPRGVASTRKSLTPEEPLKPVESVNS